MNIPKEITIGLTQYNVAKVLQTTKKMAIIRLEGLRGSVVIKGRHVEVDGKRQKDVKFHSRPTMMW